MAIVWATRRDNLKANQAEHTSVVVSFGPALVSASHHAIETKVFVASTSYSHIDTLTVLSNLRADVFCP